MDTEPVHDLLSDLTTSLDGLETVIAPLLSAPLTSSTTKLPLLDKAKLYVLATYAIETLLFNYLRINGADAKSHPVFQELNRVKEYFAKIQKAENPHAGRGRLDKAAVGRFVKNGLAGNEHYDSERAERQRETGSAKRKLEEMSTGTHTRFDSTANQKHNQEGEKTVPVVKADDVISDDDEDADSGIEEKEKRSLGPRPGSRSTKNTRRDRPNIGIRGEEPGVKKAIKRKKRQEMPK